jgi:thioredoxin 1
LKDLTQTIFVEETMAKLIEVTSANFDTEVINAAGLVLIDFWAPWCGPCRMQSPILEKLSQSPDITATFAKINTDENPEIAQKFGISSIPTLVLMDKGKEIDRFVGVQPESVLKQKLAK